MKTECSLEKLKLAVARAERVTSKNLSLPTISFIYLEAVAQNIIIRATNLDLGFEETIPSKTDKNGVAVLSGSALNGILSTAKKEKTVKIEGVNKNTSISFGGNSFLIKNQNPTDFPQLPKVVSNETIKIKTDELISGIKTVSYASSTSDIKPEIGSVYIYSSEEGVVFVATDSFRLAEKKFFLKTKHEFKTIIPHRNALEIVRVFEDGGGELTIKTDKNQLFISNNDGVSMVSRIISGVFPNYQMIIPTHKTTTINIEKNELLNALKMSSVFSGKLNRANLKCYGKDKIVEIETKDESIGEGVVRPKAEINGEDVDVVFNVRYIVDCIQSITGDKIEMSFNGPSKPIIVRGLGDDSFMYLVMPMAH